MRKLDLATGFLLYFVYLFASSTDDFAEKQRDTEVKHRAPLGEDGYAFVLTETNHGVGHAAFFCKRGGSNATKKKYIYYFLSF